MTPKQARRAARRLFRLSCIDGALDETRVRRIAQRIAESGRRGSIAILWDFLRLVRLDLERRTAVVESAVPLTNEMRDGVRAGLTRKYGSRVTTSFALDPTLIGGVRIKVGSDVLDGSVRGRLAALQARL